MVGEIDVGEKKGCMKEAKRDDAIMPEKDVGKA